MKWREIRDMFRIDDPGYFKILGKASVIGLHMVSGMVAGAAVGYGLDWLLGTGPWLLRIFFIFGIGAGFWNVHLDTKLLLKMLKEEEQREAESAAAQRKAFRPRKGRVKSSGIGKSGEADNGANGAEGDDNSDADK